MSKEIELKMVALPLVNGESLSGLFKALGAKEVKETWLVNTYFDTDDLQLNKARIALRIRQKDGCFIQTLKTKGETIGGLSQRGEWEWDVSGDSLDTTLLHEGGWPSEISVDNLVSVFETNFKRTSAIIECRGTKIECAVDDGYVSVGDHRSPLVEIELEIIEGDVDVLFEVASTIANIRPVILADVSKAEKGYRLIDKKLLNGFSFPFKCKGDYKAYIVALVSRNLSYWLFLVDRLSIGSARNLLIELIGVLVALREMVGFYRSVDSAKEFAFTDLFGLEIESLSVLLKELDDGGEAACVDRLLSPGRAGVLSIELSRWLRTI